MPKLSLFGQVKQLEYKRATPETSPQKFHGLTERAAQTIRFDVATSFEGDKSQHKRTFKCTPHKRKRDQMSDANCLVSQRTSGDVSDLISLSQSYNKARNFAATLSNVPHFRRTAKAVSVKKGHTGVDLHKMQENLSDLAAYVERRSPMDGRS